MEQYRALVARAMDDVLQGIEPVRPFENFGLDHAKIVVDEMIRRASSSVKIYSQKVNADVYEPQWFRDFLNHSPETSLTIIVERADVFSNPESTLNRIQDLRAEKRMSVRILPEKFWGKHVAIVDDIFARVETSQEKFTASVSLGKLPLTETAIKTFAELERRSVPLGA